MTFIAAILLFLTIWIAIPAPNVWLLPLGVGAPELSAVLLAVSVLALLGSFRGKVKKIAVLFSLVAAGLSAIPLSQISRTRESFDRRMATAFPGMKDTGDMRPSPIVVRDLFLGLQTGEPRVSRGLVFAAPEGLQLALDVYKPPVQGRGYPVIVQVHGGSWQRGGRTDQETFARYFASRGYVVLAIDYRLAPRWQWPAQLDDVTAAVAWIRTNEMTHEGDADRVAVLGRSAGGHLALMAAYSGKAQIRSVISYYGPTDLTEGWNDPPQPDPASVRGLLETFLGGDPATVPSRYTEASPVTWASGRVPPTMQIQGARDHVVRPRFARDLHQRLQAAGTTSVLLEIPWSEHAFDEVPHGLGGQLSVYYVERFLSATLAPRR